MGDRISLIVLGINECGQWTKDRIRKILHEKGAEDIDEDGGEFTAKVGGEKLNNIRIGLTKEGGKFLNSVYNADAGWVSTFSFRRSNF